MEYNGVKKIYEIKLTEEELKKILEEYFKQKNIFFLKLFFIHSLSVYLQK